MPTGIRTWTLPEAPSGATSSITSNGNMAFHVMRFDGATETVQANVAATATQAQVAFGPSTLLGNNVVVDESWNPPLPTTITLNGVARIAVVDGLGNAAVGCGTGGATSLQNTVALLSHNLSLVTLDHALTHGLAGITFDMMDCAHYDLAGAGGHTEWIRFDPNGNLSAGNDPAATTATPIMTRAEVNTWLSDTGFEFAPGQTDRARIYELNLMVAGVPQRMFFILQHTSGTQPYVILMMPR